MLRAVPDLAPDPSVPAAARAGAGTDAVYRQGITSARRELRAGTARRHRHAVTDAGTGLVAASVLAPDAELRTQRAGVRAALAELRQHRGQA